MDLSLPCQSRDAEEWHPAALPGLGPWVGARVASPLCLILQPSPTSVPQLREAGKSLLVDWGPVPWLLPPGLGRCQLPSRVSPALVRSTRLLTDEDIEMRI